MTPDLPIEDPTAGLEDYVAAVEAEVGERGERAEPPVVVGSSFGAVTACVYAARHEVRALVTVCGLVPRPGRAIGDEMGELIQPAFASAVRPHPDRTTTLDPEGAKELIFHECDPDLAEEAASRLRHQAALPFTQPAPFEALPDVRRVGIVSPGDRLVRPGWLAAAVRERLGVEPYELPGDHGPMLSQPGRLAEVLLAEAIAGVR